MRLWKGLALSLLAPCLAEDFLRRLGDNFTDGNLTNTTSTDTTTLSTTVAAVTTVGGNVATTLTATTTTMPRDALSPTTLVIIFVFLGVIILSLLGLAIYGVMVWMQQSARDNIKLVKQVDSEAADFEANLTSLASHVQRFNHRLEEKALKEKVRDLTACLTRWKSTEAQSRDFLDIQYTPCLRERQEQQRRKDQIRRQKKMKRLEAAKQQQQKQLMTQIRQKRAELAKEEKQRVKETGQPARSKEELDALAAQMVRSGQEDSGRAVLVIGASSANLAPEEEVGLCPGPVVTRNSELRLQLKSLETLRNAHAATVTELKELRDQAGITGLEDLELRLPSEVPKSQGWWGGGTHNYLDDQVKVIKSFAHPLLLKIQVKSHGVLGVAEGQSELAPLTPVEAVVVDPAGFPFIGYRNSCRGAGGASGSIYKWLNLTAAPANGRFPPEVNRHFAATREAEAETRAKLHAYKPGQVVIHTVGPKLRDLLPGVHGLSRAYLNVLTEYCQAILQEEAAPPAGAANPAKGASKGSQGSGKEPVRIPRVLRLCPISSGIFCEDHRLQPHMAEVTWASLSLALAMLPMALQDLLKSVELEVCVFQSREVAAYQAALEPRKAMVSGSPKLSTDRGRVASRGSGSGFDWVRKQNQPQDRLERLAAFMLTAQATASGGYELAEKKQLQLQPMLDGTRILCAKPLEEGTASSGMPLTSVSTAGRASPPRSASPAAPVAGAPVAAAPAGPAGPAGPAAPRTPSPEVKAGVPKVTFAEDGLTVVDAAVKVQKEGRKAAAVNAASAYSVGGGVLSGGRHALEESCCMVSTLLASLQKAQWDQLQAEEKKDKLNDTGGRWREPEEDFHAHVPVDGCIVSPFVEVFREGSNDGYGFLESPVKLQGIVSVAMFNMNPRVSDSPLDAPRDFKAYCQQVKLKFRAVVTAAVEMGAEVLVCPDVGCGVFGNEPKVLGTLLGEVLREPQAQNLNEVLVTGQVAFAEAVRKAAGGEKVELSPPAYFAAVYGKTGKSGGRGGRQPANPTVVVATVAAPASEGSGSRVTPVQQVAAPAAGGSGSRVTPVQQVAAPAAGGSESRGPAQVAAPASEGSGSRVTPVQQVAAPAAGGSGSRVTPVQQVAAPAAGGAESRGPSG